MDQPGPAVDRIRNVGHRVIAVAFGCLAVFLLVMLTSPPVVAWVVRPLAAAAAAAVAVGLWRLEVTVHESGIRVRGAVALGFYPWADVEGFLLEDGPQPDLLLKDGSRIRLYAVDPAGTSSTSATRSTCSTATGTCTRGSFTS